MQLSKLISDLQEVLDDYGDLPVVTSMYSENINKDVFNDFEYVGDYVYELEEGDEYEEYVGRRENIYGNVVVISHGEY